MFAPKFDLGRHTHSFRFQSQEGGQNSAPLLLSELITILLEMCPRPSSLREVHAHGSPGLYLRTSQEKRHWGDSRDGRGVCMLQVSENHTETLKRGANIQRPPPDDSQ